MAPEIPDTTLETGTQTVSNLGPIPMSFPAILRAPKLTDRFAHLRLASALENPTSDSARFVVKKDRREDREGKRWIRRKENSYFVGNPHVVAATKNDYQVFPPDVKSTFPEPLPAYLSRNTSVSALTPARKPDPNSSSAGRFSLGIKGMRKELRKAGSRAQHLIKDVESEIVSWLHGGAVFFSPDEKNPNDFEFPGKPIGDSGVIHEVARTPLQLVWAISEDGFARYVVHCCARYHEIVSFSKDTSGQRLTFLLRPNVTRPAPGTTNPDTPPATDFGYSSPGDLEDESDIIISDHELASSVGSLPLHSGPQPTPGVRVITRARSYKSDSGDEWSVIGDDLDADAELSGGEFGGRYERPTANTTPPEGPDTDNLTVEGTQIINRTALPRVWNPRSRNTSSPSRSPARRSCPSRRTLFRYEPPQDRTVKSFYMYLFGDR